MSKIRICDIAEQVRGVSYKPCDIHSELNENSVMLLRANNISDGKINFDDVVYVDKSRVSQKQFLRRGDILVCASSGSKDLVGKAASIDFDTECTFGAFCKAVRPNAKFANYLGVYFQSNAYRRKIFDVAVGANINNIKNEHIDLLEIPTYDEICTEQFIDQIVKIQNVIKCRKKQLEKLDELVKARFVEMFGDPETNPYGWQKVTVGEVCSSIVRGPFGSALKKEFFVEPNETTYKVYEQKHAIQKSANIGTYYVTAEKFDELRRFECVAGDILMSCSGTMGELYQLPEDCEKGLINQALCKFTLNEKILPIVFLTYMKQTIGNLETKGSGIQNIAAVSYVKAMPINLAPMEVQKQFAAFVEQVDKAKVAVQKALDEAQTLFDSLMQQYFG